MDQELHPFSLPAPSSSGSVLGTGAMLASTGGEPMQADQCRS